jgi:aldose 1-epimerase
MSKSSLLALAAAAAAAAVAAVLAAAARKRRSGSKPSAKQLDKLEAVVLKNRDGVEVHITPVGASIQRFILPLGQGERRDVVLGFNKASTYAVSVCPGPGSSD